MPYIHALATAVPAYCIAQDQALAFMQTYLSCNETIKRKLAILYKQTHIEQRFSVLPDFLSPKERTFFKPNYVPTTQERMAIYQREALPLAQQAAENAFKQIPTLSRKQITHLITVSCTGMYAPGLDIDLVQKLGLSTHTERICVNFMGCYATFNALRIARAISQANPQAVILIIAVELCTIHLQNQLDEDSLIAASLFADGAGAIIVSQQLTPKLLKINQFYTDLALQGTADMAWHIGNTGFEMRLSSYVPTLLERAIPVLWQQLAQNTGPSLQDIRYFAMHPGGKRILQAIEKALAISPEQNCLAHEILKNYGNMSSVTIIFVWYVLCQQFAQNKPQPQEKILSLAFGPGLTIESIILETV